LNPEPLNPEPLNLEPLNLEPLNPEPDVDVNDKKMTLYGFKQENFALSSRVRHPNCMYPTEIIN
jgi:hypothetical protein